MIARIVLLTVLLHMAFASMRMTASLDALAHHADPFEVGLLMGLIALCPMFLAIACGRWVDRVGSKIPLVLGSLVLFVGALIPILIPTQRVGLAPLYASCSLIGIGFMCVHLVSQQLVGHLSTAKNRTGAFSLLAMGFAASGLCSPLISGYMIDHLGYRWAFGGSFALTAMGFLVFLTLLPNLPAAWGAPKKAGERQRTMDLLKLPRVRNVLLVSALVSMAWDLQNFMFPVYGHAIGLSASEIGWLVATFFSASFLVRFLLPILSHYITEWQFLFGVLVIACGCYAVFPLFDTLTPLLIIAFVLGLGLGASQPNVMSLLHTQTPEGRVGEALGIRTMLMNASHTGLPLLFGVLTGAIGVFWIFMAMAALMGVSSIAVLRRDKDGETDD